MHRRIPRLVRAKAETNDVVQDTLVRALRHTPELDPRDDRRVRALLARIADTVLLDLVDWFTSQRRSVARERVLPSDTGLGPDGSYRDPESTSRIVQNREARAHVREAMKRIAHPKRALIEDYDWRGLSFSELGIRHGLSKSEARRRYLEALRDLVQEVRAVRGEVADR